jgi:hypothetical protein
MLEQFKGPASRFDCPSCGAKKEFTRYISNENNYYSELVGRCNRELKCGYHLTPSQYFKANPNSLLFDYSYVRQVKHQSKEIDLIPIQVLNDSLTHWRSNNFAKYLSLLVGWDIVKKVVDKYKIGSSKHWSGATVFWQLDLQGRPRQAKVMHYNAESGRRTRSKDEALKWNYSNSNYYTDKGETDKVFYAGKSILNNYEANLKQCFFGEHLLAESTNGIVCIVESEKTAVLASLYMPSFIWLATGGKHGCRWTSKEVCKVLEGRTINLFPDLGCLDEWSNKMNVIQTLIDCKIKTSNLIEEKATSIQKEKGYDLADLLLKLDTTTGWALTENNYPLMWDL